MTLILLCFWQTHKTKYDTHSELIIVDPVPWLGLVDSCEQHRRNISSLNIFHEHHRIRPIWTLLLLLFFLVQFGIIRLMFNLNFAKECHVCSLISCETLLEEGEISKLDQSSSSSRNFYQSQQKLMITIGLQKNVYVYHDWYA